MAHKFHGIKLALNSYIENATFEILATDPNPLTQGRIWFNSTEKLFKFSSLTVGDVVIVSSFASAAELTAAIASLQAALDAEVTARTTGDADEVAARTAAIATLTQALADEVAARTGADSTESLARIAGDATEAADRTAAIAVAAATASDATAAEIAARTAADAALNIRVDNVWAELDITQLASGLNIDGTFTAPLNTVNLGLAVSLKDGLVKLDDALAIEVAARTSSYTAISTGLTNEAQIRADADIALQTQITEWVNVQISTNASADLVEQAARIAADIAIKAEIDLTQTTIGTAPDGSLIPIVGTNYLNTITSVFGGMFIFDTLIKANADAIATEIAARQTAIGILDSALTSEITTRTNADTAIQTELNTTQVGAGLELDGTYLPSIGSNYLALATSLKDADAKLDAAVMSISSRVTAIETVSIPSLQSQITAEVNRATAAETTEASTRATNDNAITANVTAEVNRATASEAMLADMVTTETTRATGAEAGLQVQITTLSTEAGTGAVALKTALNAGRYTYLSVAAALQHIVQHNLNTQFYSANIMVQGIDGVWRNDIVPVEDIDLNSYSITLTEACMVKASGQSNAQLV